MVMNQVNRTLSIPRYGKSYVSKKGIILSDPTAEEIWAAEGFALKGKSRSKWLAYYMGMRAAVFDRWMKQQLDAMPGAVVLHLGCGMDSRVLRVGAQRLWYDVDFPDVIAERKKYYRETEHYKMLGTDVRNQDFLAQIDAKNAIVVMEGISMYLKREELTQILTGLCAHFEQVALLMDCYTELAAKASRYKNPINDVGVTEVYGLDDPVLLENSGLAFIREHEMTLAELIVQLRGAERFVFEKLYAGSIAKKMYRLYEYRR